jgi:hypothetical protein
MQMLYQLSYAPDDRETFRCSGSDSSSSEDSASNECNPGVGARPGRSGPEARVRGGGDERTIHLA